MPTLDRNDHILTGSYPLSHAAFPCFIHLPVARLEEVTLLPFSNQITITLNATAPDPPTTN